MKPIKLESAKCQSGTPQNFRIALSNENRLVSGHKYELQQFVMPNAYYNFNSSNNVVRYNLNAAGATSTSITPGNYNSTNLAAAVQTALGAGWTCTLNANTAVFTISHTQTFTLLFSESTNSAASILGYEDEDLAAALTHSGVRQVNLTDVLSVDLQIRGLSGISLADGTDYAYSIPINVASGELIIWEATLYRQIATCSSNIANMEVIVKDSNTGREIPIQLDWYFVIQEVL